MPLLAHLSPTLLKTVADRCTEMNFAKGADVVRQGEEGDAFYVVTRGTADVLRYPEDARDAADDDDERSTAPPKLLAQLGKGQSFGERALLKNDTRFASVRVTSDELQVMSISRRVAEAALGVTSLTELPPAEDGRHGQSPEAGVDGDEAAGPDDGFVGYGETRVGKGAKGR